MGLPLGLWACRGRQCCRWLPGSRMALVPAGNAPLFRADCELQQLSCVMSILGTYAPETWGGEHLLPDYGKIVLGASDPVPMAELFPDARASAHDLLAGLLSCAPPAVVRAERRSAVAATAAALGGAGRRCAPWPHVWVRECSGM